MKSQNGKRYLTAETPPANEDSTVVPTTAWVQDKIDGVESAVSGEMFPTVKATTYTKDEILREGYTYAPNGGGTWWCFGIGKYTTYKGSTSTSTILDFTFNTSCASGTLLHSFTRDQGNLTSYVSYGFGIKIA